MKSIVWSALTILFIAQLMLGVTDRLRLNSNTSMQLNASGEIINCHSEWRRIEYIFPMYRVGCKIAPVIRWLKDRPKGE